MSGYQIRSDIQRARIGEFWLPLGLEPGELTEPEEGYSVSFMPGSDDDPDVYVFSVVVSHDRLKSLLGKVFELLPAEVYAIVEIGSRDAYRPVDEFISAEAISREHFIDVWTMFEPILLEDCAIAAGANSEDPFVEVFVDHLKGFVIHVPPSMRDEAEAMLREAELEEIQFDEEAEDDDQADDLPIPSDSSTRLRPVLDLSDDDALDLDDVLFELRREWDMELNVEAEKNLDAGGRDLGMTLWHGVVLVEHKEDSAVQTRLHVWATSNSLANVLELFRTELDELRDWRMTEVFTLDRVAYDERPDELADLPPRTDEQKVHLLEIAHVGGAETNG